MSALANDMDFREMLDAARVRLVIDHPFFASLLMSTPMVESERFAFMGTDGVSIFWNPAGVTRLQTTENVRFLLCHEVLHILLRHLSRGEGRERADLFEVAIDAVANAVLAQNGFLFDTVAVPEANIVDRTDLAKRGVRQLDPADASAEEVYEALLAVPKPPSPTGGGGRGNSGGGGKGNEQTDDDRGGDGGDGEREVDGAGLDGHVFRSLDPEQTLELKVAVARAAQTATRYGKEPEGLGRWISELLAPEVDWKTVLRRFVRDRVSGYRETRLYPSKKSHALGIFQPRYSDERLGDIVAAVDTSGSVDDGMLKSFVSEVVSIAGQARKTYVMACDAEVHDVIELKGSGNPEFVFRRLMQLKGGGGTDFRPVFREIEKRRIRPRAVVYLTDADGPFPPAAPRGYKTLWCVKGGRPVPWGQKVRVKV